MSLYGKLKETFFEPATETTFVLAFKPLEFRPKWRGRPEEIVTRFRHEFYIRSFGVIDIADATIRWVNITVEPGNVLQVSDHFWAHTVAEFGVPDSLMDLTHPSVSIQSQNKPLFGKTTEVRWVGHDFGLGILSRLTDDDSLPTNYRRVCPDIDKGIF